MENATERRCMARTGIVFGLILCGITIAGLVVMPAKTPTQFYGMMLGIPILFCGVVALNPHRRRLAMSFAAAIALIGAVVGGLWSVVQLLAFSNTFSEIDRYSLRLVAIMTVVCMLFVGFCVIGFSRLRRRSKNRQPIPAPMVRLPSAADKITTDAEVPTSRDIA